MLTIFFSPFLLLKYCNINVNTPTQAHHVNVQLFQHVVYEIGTHFALIETLEVEKEVFVVATVTLTVVVTVLKLIILLTRVLKILGVAGSEPAFLALMSCMDVSMWDAPERKWLFSCAKFSKFSKPMGSASMRGSNDTGTILHNGQFRLAVQSIKPIQT